MQDVFKQEILALHRQVENHGNAGGFPFDIKLYLKRIKNEYQQELPKDFMTTSMAVNCQTSNASASLVETDFISDELGIGSCVEDFSVLYQSQPNQKDLCVKIYDPRLIVSRPCLNDLISFFLTGYSTSQSYALTTSQQPATYSHQPSTTLSEGSDAVEDKLNDNTALTSIEDESREAQQITPSITIGETSFHMRIELSNASVILPQSLDDIDASLFLMRGTFQIGQTRVTNCSDPLVSVNDAQTEDHQAISYYLEASAPMQNQTDEEIHALSSHAILEDTGPSKSEIIQSKHYSASVTQVEIFICDLKTLNLIELVERAQLRKLRTAEFTPKASKTQKSTTQKLRSFGSTCFTSDLEDARRIQTMPTVSVVPTPSTSNEDRLSIRACINQMSMFLEQCDKSQAQSQLSDLIRSTSTFTQAVESRPLTLKDLLGLSSSSRRALETELAAPESSSGIDDQLQWEDLVRLLCPSVECVLNVTDKTIQEYSWNVNRYIANEELEEPTRSIVVSIQPINLDVSYMDLVFLKRCLTLLDQDIQEANNCVEESLNDTEASTKQISTNLDQSTQLSIQTQKTISIDRALAQRPFKTKVDVDLAEMKILVLNDSNEFLSAPFMELIFHSGSLSSIAEGDVSSRRSRMDISLASSLRFFNPRAVTFEPILEYFKFRCLCGTMTVSSSSPLTLDGNSKGEHQYRNVIDLSLTGSKTEPLCLNISHVLLESVLMNIKKLAEEFGQASATQKTSSDVTAVHGVPNKTTTKVTGMFRFTPYSVRNESGMTLSVSIPAGRRSKELVIQHQTSSNFIYVNDGVLRPNQIHRLNKLQVDVRDKHQTNFKIQLAVSFNFMMMSLI